MADRFGATKLSSDAELISAARSGDEGAFGLLYGRHAGAARRLARLIVHRAEVDDVVAEAFAEVLDAIRRGVGPSEAFRPYLLTVVRRIGHDLSRSQHQSVLIDDSDLAGNERTVDGSMIARAFRSLPERWSAVLWHAEVELARPSEVAVLLGLTPDAVSALSRRAREGLRQAYSQIHVAAQTEDECSAAAGKLAAFVRDRLSGRDGRRIANHLRSCGSCTAACAELTALNGSLRGLVGQVILGGEAAAYLTHASHAVTRTSTPLFSLRKLVWPRPVLPVVAGIALTAGLLPTGILGHIISHHGVTSTAMAAPPGAQNAAGNAPRRAASPTAAARRSHSPRHRASPRPAPSTPVASPSAGAPQPRSPSPTARSSSDRLHARLGALVTVAGSLKPGHVAIVTVQVSDSGTAPTEAITSELSVPPGTVVLRQAGGSDAWTCASNSSGSEACTRAALAAGTGSSVAFRLHVVSHAGCGGRITATVTSGALSVTSTSSRRIGPCHFDE